MNTKIEQYLCRLSLKRQATLGQVHTLKRKNEKRKRGSQSEFMERQKQTNEMYRLLLLRVPIFFGFRFSAFRFSVKM